jgi:hypothetical protein
VVAGFCRFLDKSLPHPTNHWARQPAPGSWHNPFPCRHLDTDHSYEGTREVLNRAMDFFPKATVVGDGWDSDGVRRAVEDAARERAVRYEAHGSGWRILR